MIPHRHYVELLLLDNVEGIFAWRFAGVVEAVAFDSVAGVDEEQIGAIRVGAGVEVLGEGDVVAPIGGVLGFAKMARVPAVGICCVLYIIVFSEFVEST